MVGQSSMTDRTIEPFPHWAGLYAAVPLMSTGFPGEIVPMVYLQRRLSK